MYCTSSVSRAPKGVPSNDEQIELFFLEKNKIDEFIFDETKAKTPGLIFSLYWFLKNQNELELK